MAGSNQQAPQTLNGEQSAALFEASHQGYIALLEAGIEREQHEPQAIGGIDVEEFSPLHKYGIEDLDYVSNDPKAVEDLIDFEGGYHMRNIVIDPSKLDDMKPGLYVIAERKRFYDYENSQGKELFRVGLERKIEISETPKGKVVGVDAFKKQPIAAIASSGTDWLMSDLGYIVDENHAITAAPTPNTLVASAKELGVGIDLFRSNRINGLGYLDSYSKGKHPIAATSEEWYVHDSGDVHMTAMVLGGSLLRDALSAAATRALETEERRTIDGAASSIDTFTAALAGSLYRRSKKRFGLGYDYMVEAGEELGIDRGTISAIFDAAHQKALDYGIQTLSDADSGRSDYV